MVVPAKRNRRHRKCHPGNSAKETPITKVEVEATEEEEISKVVEAAAEVVVTVDIKAEDTKEVDVKEEDTKEEEGVKAGDTKAEVIQMTATKKVDITGVEAAVEVVMVEEEEVATEVGEEIVVFRERDGTSDQLMIEAS